MQPIKFVKREMKPQTLKIAGETYPAIFNYNAIIEMESVTDLAYSATIYKIEANYDEYGNLIQDINDIIPRIPVSASEISGLVFGMLKAAGVGVQIQDITDTLLPTDTKDLIIQVKKILKDQDVKNSKTPTKTSGKSTEKSEKK